MSETRTFNTPLEAGLRILFVLSAARRRAFDVQRLVYFDYLLVHSGDLEGPESLHPRTPTQKGELLVRRKLVHEGLALMRSRELIVRKFQAGGIAYASTPAGRHVADQFDSRYAEMLRERAAWVINEYGGSSDRALAKVLGAEVGAWEDELIEDVQPPTSGSDV